MDLGHGRTSSSPSSSRLHQRMSLPTEDAAAVEKEHMFDKVVTPSDVGKLNRLVVPKQHAEKHFPLDASASEKGLLLSFEDPFGKPWSFRYSYWNSSQSYVMTKGWSRFVKDKRLDAGDTVSFARGVGGSANGRLFIDWKRRPELLPQPRSPFPVFAAPSSYPWAGRVLVPGYRYSGPLRAAAFRSPALPPPFQLQHASADSAMVPVGHSRQQATSKRVRLFGVNLDEYPLQQEQQRSLDPEL